MPQRLHSAQQTSHACISLSSHGSSNTIKASQMRAAPQLLSALRGRQQKWQKQNEHCYSKGHKRTACPTSLPPHTTPFFIHNPWLCWLSAPQIVQSSPGPQTRPAVSRSPSRPPSSRGPSAYTLDTLVCPMLCHYFQAHRAGFPQTGAAAHGTTPQPHAPQAGRAGMQDAEGLYGRQAGLGRYSAQQHAVLCGVWKLHSLSSVRATAHTPHTQQQLAAQTCWHPHQPELSACRQLV